MLEYEVDIPDQPSDGAPLVVLLHGRGSNRFDLMGLRRGLPDDAIVVTPEAPFPAAPWGYGPGSAWYRYIGGNTPEPESFSQSLRELDDFLKAIRGELPVDPGPIALGGFSQGGTTSLAYALKHAGTIPCVLNFSGFLADHPDVIASADTVAGTRFFWGHGVQDPAIPFAMAEQGWAALRGAGADLSANEYPIGHWIDPAELRTATEWLEDSFARLTNDAFRNGRVDE